MMSDVKHPLEGKGLIIITGGEIGPGKSTLLSSGIQLLKEQMIRTADDATEHCITIDWFDEGSRD